MLLERCKSKLGEPGGRQCSGPGRQASDFVFTLDRPMNVEGEWRLGLRWIKVDVQKAVDRVSGEKLMSMLLARLGRNRLSREWHSLLGPTQAHLQTSWASSTFDMCTGIRQGAVESPVLFSLLAELCFQTTADKHRWAVDVPHTDGLPVRDALFMDDAILRDVRADTLATRVQQLADELVW